MPVHHAGAHSRCQPQHDELACHAQGEKRAEIIRLLNCWIDYIEHPTPIKKKLEEEPCQGSTLCNPGFSCTEGTPFATRGCTYDPPQDPYQRPPLWSMEYKHEIPVWERPRVKSALLIGGDWKKVKECFRANGLNDFDYCPRTMSCELMKCMDEMIAEDKRIHGPEAMAPDCCCRPGDAPSRNPQYKCTSCEPPSPYGYKNLDCPREIGRKESRHNCNGGPHSK